ncbi:MAG: hypothetical protein JWQ27_221 [Ferruginibacter sp.]|nr:hypothetical protein [Ferruginibacter sp.]
MSDTIVFAAAIVLAVCGLIFLLVFIARKKQRRHEQMQLHEFNAFATANGLHINKQQRLNQRLIGCDDRKGKLLYADFNIQPVKMHIVDLVAAAGAQVITHSRKTTDHNNQSDTLIESVELNLRFTDRLQAPATLVFYEFGLDSFDQMLYLREQAGHWKTIIETYSTV